MSLAIQELQAAPHHGAVEAFFRDREFPIVEGKKVTFVWRGHADEVVLQHWIQGVPPQMPFQRLHGTDLWYLVIEIPAGSRVEYKIGLRQGHQQMLVQDPLNPHHARDPFGANSVVRADGYRVPDWTLPNPDARTGDLLDLDVQSAAFGDQRQVQVYLPARFRKTRRYPLLVVHDGADFLRFASLQTVLDNLIHRLEIPPLVAALTTSHDRMTEYGADPRHGRFVVEDLLPAMEQKFPLFEDPQWRCLLGASFGGVAALSTAWRHPGVFGNICLMSGSFLFTDIGEHEGGPAFDKVVEFVGEFRANPGHPADKVFLTCGTYEPMIYYNRSMVPVLQETGMNVRFTEARDGHNWENWRDRLRESLAWLFPGPLWMVYE